MQFPSTVARVPEHTDESVNEQIHRDMERRVALFAPGIEVPLVPFMGIMAVMPPKELTNTRPPEPGPGVSGHSQGTVTVPTAALAQR